MHDTAGVIDPTSYERWRRSKLGQVTERLETTLVLELAGRLAGKRVLDVGTGDGAYAIEAAARGARVSGVDTSASMLAAAARRSEQRGAVVELREARAEDLPYEDGAFDLVLAVTVLCFMEDADRALREMARVLAPGGRLVLGELSRWSLWAMERRVRAWLGSRTWRHARFRSRRELVSLATDAGLHVDAVRGAIFYPPSNLAAGLTAPVDPLLGRLHAPGAAFLALAARKPGVARL